MISLNPHQNCPGKAPLQQCDNVIRKGSDHRGHTSHVVMQQRWQCHSGTALGSQQLTPGACTLPCDCLGNPLPPLGLGPPNLTRGGSTYWAAISIKRVNTSNVPGRMPPTPYCLYPNHLIRGGILSLRRGHYGDLVKSATTRCGDCGRRHAKRTQCGFWEEPGLGSEPIPASDSPQAVLVIRDGRRMKWDETG